MKNQMKHVNLTSPREAGGAMQRAALPKHTVVSRETKSFSHDRVPRQERFTSPITFAQSRWFPPNAHRVLAPSCHSCLFSFGLCAKLFANSLQLSWRPKFLLPPITRPLQWNDLLAVV